MESKMIGIIILAIITIIFTIWCFVDGIYYLAIFGLFILGYQIYNYISIKKKLKTK
mgnify:FL=1